MSEEFDKEAEREKLREKYEADAEKRNATQQMSELLLRGATMTNQHCDRCGDPLFRENGEMFCPTCTNEEGAAEQATQTADTGAETPVDAGTQPEAAGEQHGQPSQAEQHGQHSQPSQAAHPDQQSPRGPADSTAGNSAGRTESLSQLPDNAEVVAQAGDQPTERRVASPQRDSGATEPTDAPADPTAELQRAVTETARKASAATDPRTARAWLEASKEAAEALAALER